MPEKLGQYVIERKLGAGAMGVVYLGRDPILDRQVAIKVLPASLSRDEERLQRFLREAKSAARLHHTNVAAVHQAGSEGRLAYIAMEYVEGKSLDKVVTESQPLGWREATRVIRDAAAGLGAAHAIGLIHRDVKPANLIRTTDGVTKVVDFGLARGQHTNTQLTQQGTLLGTPAYMAPEQWGGGEVDGRTDLYALTCTYYYLLTGRVPFDAPSLPALGYQHRYEPFPDPRPHAADVPDGICRILTRGSAKEASERFQTAEDLVAELNVLLVCPNESLTFGSSWDQVAAPAGAELSPLDYPLTDPLADLLCDPLASVDLGVVADQTSPSRIAKPTPWPTSRSKPALPVWVWIAAGGGAALLLLLGVMIAFSTKYGLVQIEVLGAEAEDVNITLDGETITIDSLDEPLEVKVGEHNLVARAADFEAVTRSFQVKRNEITVVDVSFEPNVVDAPTTEPLPPEPSSEPTIPGLQFPATYSVTLDPPEAILAASGEGASVTGQGASRTLKVTEPDGERTITLVATLDDYKDFRQELQPTAGESRILDIRLEPVAKQPAPGVPVAASYRVTVNPPEAILTASGEGVSVAGQQGQYTITVAAPDGKTITTLVATLDGYEDLRQEFRPSSGESRDLTFRLEPMRSQPTNDDAGRQSGPAMVGSEMPGSEPTRRGSNAAVVPRGCVVAYTFDRDTIFTQGTQQYVRDLSGNDYHGLLNNVSIVDGKVGTAAEFAGRTDCFVKLPDENGQYPARDFTIMAWVFGTVDHPRDGSGFESAAGTILDLNFAGSDVAQMNGGIACAQYYTSSKRLNLFCCINHRRVFHEERIHSSGNAVPQSRWTHIAVTRENNAATFFVNAKVDQRCNLPDGTITYDYQGYDDNSTHIGVHKRTGFDAWAYQGLIDEFVLFDRALSEEEIADLCQRQAGRR